MLTEAAFESMIERATRYTAGVQDVIDRTGVDVVGDAARSSLRVPVRKARTGERQRARPPPATPSSRTTCTCTLANRGVLITPFHNMALMSPATTDADVDRHTELFAEALQTLLGI